mmetsp:Transcript_2884/g.3519  ORF Transcript_2884/g.3519 Transcript_2884/m.3519 type:complete len:117 (-) Transcript_2884:31-381(-)
MTEVKSDGVITPQNNDDSSVNAETSTSKDLIKGPSLPPWNIIVSCVVIGYFIARVITFPNQEKKTNVQKSSAFVKCGDIFCAFIILSIALKDPSTLKITLATCGLLFHLIKCYFDK